MDPSVESAAWFVISEALTNAIKHSEAELITVRIRTGDRLTVQVSDNGVGMAGPTTGHGVTGMRDRVATLGGELTFGAGPGGGTVVDFWIPLPAAEPAAGEPADLVLVDQAVVDQAVEDQAVPHQEEVDPPAVVRASGAL
jgi:signal transduction histidine kinase